MRSGQDDLCGQVIFFFFFLRFFLDCAPFQKWLTFIFHAFICWPIEINFQVRNTSGGSCYCTRISSCRQRGAWNSPDWETKLSRLRSHFINADQLREKTNPKQLDLGSEIIAACHVYVVADHQERDKEPEQMCFTATVVWRLDFQTALAGNAKPWCIDS